MATTQQTAADLKSKLDADTPAPKRAASKRTASKQTAVKRRSSSVKAAAPGESVLARGKKMLGDAYNRASEAGSALPDTFASFHVPSHRSLQTLAGEKPLVLGAVGVGVGMILGAVLPSIGRLTGAMSRPTPPRSRRKRP